MYHEDSDLDEVRQGLDRSGCSESLKIYIAGTEMDRLCFQLKKERILVSNISIVKISQVPIGHTTARAI